MMINTAAVCLAAGGAKPPKSDTASVGNHRSDDVARFLRLPLIDSPLSSIWKLCTRCPVCERSNEAWQP